MKIIILKNQRIFTYLSNKYFLQLFVIELFIIRLDDYELMTELETIQYKFCIIFKI